MKNKKKPQPKLEVPVESVLTDELKKELGIADNAEGMQGSNAALITEENMPHQEPPKKKEEPYQNKLSRRKQKRLQMIEERKQKQAIRGELLERLAHSSISADQQKLLHSSKTLGQTETTKQKLRRALLEYRAGLPISVDVELFKEHTLGGGNLSDSDSSENESDREVKKQLRELMASRPKPSEVVAANKVEQKVESSNLASTKSVVAAEKPQVVAVAAKKAVVEVVTKKPTAKSTVGAPAPAATTARAVSTPESESSEGSSEREDSAAPISEQDQKALDKKQRKRLAKKQRAAAKKRKISEKGENSESSEEEEEKVGEKQQPSIPGVDTFMSQSNFVYNDAGDNAFAMFMCGGGAAAKPKPNPAVLKSVSTVIGEMKKSEKKKPAVSTAVVAAKVEPPVVVPAPSEESKKVKKPKKKKQQQEKPNGPQFLEFGKQSWGSASSSSGEDEQDESESDQDSSENVENTPKLDSAEGEMLDDLQSHVETNMATKKITKKVGESVLKQIESVKKRLRDEEEEEKSDESSLDAETPQAPPVKLAKVVKIDSSKKEKILALKAKLRAKKEVPVATTKPDEPAKKPNVDVDVKISKPVESESESSEEEEEKQQQEDSKMKTTENEEATTESSEDEETSPSSDEAPPATAQDPEMAEFREILGVPEDMPITSSDLINFTIIQNMTDQGVKKPNQKLDYKSPLGATQSERARPAESNPILALTSAAEKPLQTATAAETPTSAPAPAPGNWKKFFVHVDRTPEIQEARMKLPVCAEEQSIMESITDYPVVILCGETGSGKTTQVPQFLYEAGYSHPEGPSPGIIGCTQPRRVAAVSMARRVASELNVPFENGPVSYHVRYENNVTKQTQMKFMTDGLLLKEMQSDFLLKKYSVIILDEAHERNLNTDILIGLLSRIVPLRLQLAAKQRAKEIKIARGQALPKTKSQLPESIENEKLYPLKLVIMSATLRVEDFTMNPRLFPLPATVTEVDEIDSRRAIHASAASTTASAKQTQPQTTTATTAPSTSTDGSGGATAAQAPVAVAAPQDAGKLVGTKRPPRLSKSPLDSAIDSLVANRRLDIRKIIPPPPVIKVEARQFPVMVHFNKRTVLGDYVKEAFRKVCKIHSRLPSGGILIFLTGQGEIEYMCNLLHKQFNVKKRKKSILPRNDEKVFAEGTILDNEEEEESKKVDEPMQSDSDSDTDMKKKSENTTSTPNFKGASESTVVAHFKKIKQQKEKEKKEKLEAVHSSLSEKQKREVGGSILAKGDDFVLSDEDENEDEYEARERVSKPKKEADETKKEGLEDSENGESGDSSESEREEDFGDEEEEDDGKILFSTNSEEDNIFLETLKKEQAELAAQKDREIPKLHILPLYSMLPTHKQMLVFQPPPEGSRLCVVATNVAETSLTIPGIKYVVDCGRQKDKVYDKNTGVQEFKVQWVAKASAEQRAGRAGRTGPGHCYRLFSSAVYENLFERFSAPEIVRMPIDSVVLQMKAMGIENVRTFPFPTQPDETALNSAFKVLTCLGAIDSNSEKITPIGVEMAKYPVMPRFAKMLVLAKRDNCLPYAIAIVAALSVQEVLVRNAPRNQQGPSKSSDPQQGIDYSTLDPTKNQQGQKEQEENEEDKKEREKLIDKEFEQATKDGEEKQEESSGSDESDNEERRTRMAQREADKKLRESHAKWSHPQSDLLSLLNVIGAYEFEQGNPKFCHDQFLHAKSMKEIHQLREQITKIVLDSLDDSNPTDQSLRKTLLSKTSLSSPPTPDQQTSLRQIITAGFIDQIARRATADECSTLGIYLKRDSKGAVRRDPATQRKIPYLSLLSNQPVYIHPHSFMFDAKVKPDFVTYHELQLTSRTYMRGVTATNPAWLVALGEPMCSFSKPLPVPPPRYDKEKDQIVCWIDPAFGPSMWALPTQEREHPIGVEKYKLFARFLLDGQIFPVLKAFKNYMNPSPVVIPKLVNNNKVNAVVAQLSKYGLDTKQKLQDRWSESPNFLLAEISAIVDPRLNSALAFVWPPTKNVDEGAFARMKQAAVHKQAYEEDEEM